MSDTEGCKVHQLLYRNCRYQQQEHDSSVQVLTNPLIEIEW